MRTVRLVSLNTWKGEGDYPRRLQAMAAGLKGLSPDVVALQEDLRTDDGAIHTSRTLAEALDMHLVWVPARPCPRQVGGRRVASTSGLAVLSRLPVEEQRVVALPEDPRDGQRLGLCVRLPAPLGGIWVINLHLSHLSDGADLRRAQLDTVLRAAAAWREDRPLVLCGDFNAATSDAELAGFLQPAGPLIDAFGGATKITHRSGPGHPCDLDQILVCPDGAGVPIRRAWTALEAPDAQQKVLPSDHVAVCADLF